MTHQEIRAKFRAYMEAHGHRWASSSPLLPDDPSVLFTTAGMQQFKPYYTDPKLALAPSMASIQKCVRTGDIDEVGDESHLTFFEMLGNFSFGGYFKREAIAYAHEFITSEMGLTIDYVTVFKGEEGVPADDESEAIWISLDPSIVVKKAGRADNFWGPTGDEGPCGPTTEIYVDGIEVWNVVFNQYFQKKDGTLEPLAVSGIDTGMGLERLAMASQKVPTVFDTDLFTPFMDAAGYCERYDLRARRIVADHSRAIAALAAEGLRPSNKEQGYVLRRLIRRVVTLEYRFGPLTLNLGPVYEEEKAKFLRTLAQGQRELEHLTAIDADTAFRLFESFGLPFEVIKDLGGDKAASLTREAFDAKFKEHQQKSRAGAEKKFGGHGLLLDTGELKAANEEELKIVTRLHTATHLLHAALRKVLGGEVQQAGSDITAERTRFDFSFPRKLTKDEVNQVEALVNDAVARKLPMTKQTLPKAEAEKSGALFFFKNKYPDEVDVYTVGDSGGEWFSKEFCGGPHVTNTGDIGPVKITKEEAVSAGVRRIRASLVNP
jgi:alanyl-tRNA synthetase